MAEDKNKLEFNIDELSEAAGYSLKQLEPFRRNRKAALEQYVGAHYSDNAAADKVPVNLLELAVNIYLQRLVASSPKVAINTPIPQLREISERFKLAINHLIEDEIDLEKTLEQAVTSAMFSQGIVKVAMNESQVEYLGVLHDSGQPFASFVTLDNWIQDMTADDRSQGQFEADRYAMTKADILKMYENLNPDEVDAKKDLFTPDGNEAHNLTDNSASTRTEFEERVSVWDVWLPKYGIVVTCLDSGDHGQPFGKPINIAKWNGVETGPYHLLGFADVEANTMPLAPIASMIDIHDLVNRLFRKLGRQGERQKTFAAIPRGASADGERVRDVNDGDVQEFDSPDKIQEISTGGISVENLAFLLQCKDLYSYLAGNLDTMGGLSAQADTLGQENLLSAGASQRITRMQKKVYKFVKGICTALAFYIWTDPLIDIPVVKRVPGMDDVAVRDSFGPNDERNENDFFEYNIKIEPYSLQHQGPEQKLQALRTVFTEMLMPLMPVMAQSGIGIDFEYFFRTISELSNVPELDNILIYMDPKHQQGMVGQPPQKAAQTKHTSVRVNRPGATEKGKNQTLMHTLLGNKQQASEGAAAFRPTG